MSVVGGTVSSLDGLHALGRTFKYLLAHGIIILLVTAVAVGLAWLAAEKGKKPAMLDLGAYCGAFATFGVATAYFLSLGLSETSTGANSLLTGFVAPFIALLTGAVAYAASKKSEEIAKNDLVLGVASFLFACILSYETFNGQIGYGTGSSPTTVLKAARIVPPGNGGPPVDQGLAPPRTGNDRSGNTAGAAPDALTPPRRSSTDGLAPPRR